MDKHIFHRDINYPIFVIIALGIVFGNWNAQAQARVINLRALHNLQDRGVEVLFDKTPTPDFDGEGTVGFADFLLFVAQFGFSEDDEGYDVWFDLDGDGMIGFGDFLIFANAFGKAVSSN